MPKGSDLLVAALENEGVDRIFGVPGEENLDVVESLRSLFYNGQWLMLLAALAMGYAPAELEGLLSRNLAAWLADSREITSARLLDALRASLGLALTGGRYDAEAAHRVARFTAGGSLVNLPDVPFHLWLPSMSGSRQRQ